MSDQKTSLDVVTRLEVNAFVSSLNQPKFLFPSVQQVNVYSLFYCRFMTCCCCPAILLNRRGVWDCDCFFQSLATLCFDLSPQGPWGPYMLSNWVGKDFAASDLKTDREEKEELGRVKKKKKGKRMFEWNMKLFFYLQQHHCACTHNLLLLNKQHWRAQ